MVMILKNISNFCLASAALQPIGRKFLNLIIKIPIIVVVVCDIHVTLASLSKKKNYPPSCLEVLDKLMGQISHLPFL